MKTRWRLALPIVGLVLFGAETYHSVELNRRLYQSPSKYFWWSSIRLDTDPLNKQQWPSMHPGCTSKGANCSAWDLRDVWVDPGLLVSGLMISALPAFVIGGLAVASLGPLGINKVVTFLAFMPLLVFAWFYFLGWLVDRRRRGRRLENQGAGAR
jgi:hypothetical protein